MHLSLALNAVTGSALIIILLFAEYVRKYNTDRIQKIIFCGMMLFVFIAMMCNLTTLLIGGNPGKAVYHTLFTLNTVYYFFQTLVYYSFILFIDFMVFKNYGRVKKFALGIGIVNSIHLAVLLINLKWHFYFYIDEAANIFHYGDQYYIHLGISYCPVIFAAVELIASRRAMRGPYVFMLLLLVGVSIIGSTIDTMHGSIKLIWPSLTAAFLYSYFFIVQSDSRMDSLTGIGNRFSFNEFTDGLSRRKTGETWSFVMLDMDHFKHINDTLGHQAGDEALRDMAGIIKSHIRSSDFVARYGGDEFVLAIKSEDSIEQLMCRIEDAVNQHNAKKIRPFKLEISYGCGIYTADGSQSIAECLSRIDNLMYRHKQERRRAGDQKAAV